MGRWVRVVVAAAVLAVFAVACAPSGDSRPTLIDATVPDDEPRPARGRPTPPPAPAVDIGEAALPPPDDVAPDWSQSDWFDSPPAQLPFGDRQSEIRVTELVLGCEGSWLAPSLTMELTGRTIDLNNVDQTISFWGADGPAGREYETTDDLQSGQQETFGEFGAAGNPVDHPADYIEICSRATWPVSVALTDGEGASLEATILANVEVECESCGTPR